MDYFDILLAKKLEDDRDPKVEGLSVTENGRYHEDGVVYDPVIVEVPEPTLISKNITANGTYNASADNADGYSSVSVDVPLPSNAYLLKSIEHESIATFADGTDNFIKSLEVAIEPVQSGSGDPSPTNICPISGWTEANVNVSGVNVWDEEWESGALNNSTGMNYALAERVRSKNYISVKSNTSYYLHLPNTYSSARVACYDKNKTYLGQAKGWLSVNNNSSFATPSNTYYIRFVVVKTDETYNHDISINYPSTDTEYHAYNGQTYTIDLDGTRYGGKLDVVSGVLVVNKLFTKGITVARVGQTGSGVKYADTTNVYTGLVQNALTISDRYIQIDTSQSGEDGNFRAYNGEFTIYDNRFTDTTTAQSYLNDVEFCYELATPTTIQLTPTVVKSLRGMNNVWADSGNILDLSYLAKEE